MGWGSLLKSASSKHVNVNDPYLALLHPDAHEDGGLACNNKELLNQQREAITAWLKEAAKKILRGSINLLSTSFPVTMFEPRSYLQKLADPWVYPRFLSEAAEAEDPVERLKLVTAWFVAGLHHGFERWRKPFNPILGETWQATLSDGSAIFMEQISHHPPITAFHIDGPGGCYRLVGLSEPIVTPHVSSYGFKTVAKGYRYVQFRDGSTIELHYPHYYIKGVVQSSRPRAEVAGEACLKDVTNNLEARITFGAMKGSKQSYLQRSDAIYGAIYSTGPPSPVDTAQPEPYLVRSRTMPLENNGDCIDSSDTEEFYDADEGEVSNKEETDLLDSSPSAGSLEAALRHDPGPGIPDGNSDTSKSEDSSVHSRRNEASPGSVSILGMGLVHSFSVPNTSSPCQLEAPRGVAIAKIQGSWLSHLDFDEERYWTLKEEVVDCWTPIADPLPSDCRYREDLVWLSRGDLDRAQEWKCTLEHLQRADKKLRPHHH